MEAKGINVLIYPMYSIGNINADSNYIIIKQLVNEILKKTDKYNFLLIIDKDREYLSDDLDKRVLVIKYPMPLSKRRGVINLNTEVLKTILNTYMVDIVWNNVPEQGHNFKYFYEVVEPNFRLKVLNYHHYVIHRSLPIPTMYSPMLNVLYQQIIGSVDVDINYFHSDWCYKMLEEEAKDFLHPKQFAKIKANSVLHLGGYVEKPTEKVKKYDLYTFIYNHRLTGYKNYQETFALFDKLWEEGLRFQVILTAGDKDNVNVVAGKPYVQMKSFARHGDYLKELAKCHANVINSIHETYCIAITESIVNGLVVVMPNRVTFPQLVEKGYPYLYEDDKEHTEEYAMLKKLIKEDIRGYDYPEIDKLLLTNHAEYFITLLDRLENKSEVFASIKNPQKKEIIERFLTENKTISKDQMRAFLGRIKLATQAFPASKVNQLMREFGFTLNLKTIAYERKR